MVLAHAGLLLPRRSARRLQNQKTCTGTNGHVPSHPAPLCDTFTPSPMAKGHPVPASACVYCGIGSEQCGNMSDDGAAVKEQARTRKRRRTTKDETGRREILSLS
jgi:hypothetical protein